MTVHNVNIVATTQDKMLTQNEASYTPSVCPSAISTSTNSAPGANSAVEQHIDTLTNMMQILIQQQTAPSTSETLSQSGNEYSGTTHAASTSPITPTNANDPQSSVIMINSQGQPEKNPKEAMTHAIPCG